jgi:hypothetical protein
MFAFAHPLHRHHPNRFQHLLIECSSVSFMDGSIVGFLIRSYSLFVGDDPIRAVGGHRDPQRFHFVVFGETLDLDDLAMRPGIHQDRICISPK